MPPSIATVVFALGILGLFLLDRNRKSQTSRALWIPVVYLLISGSQAASQWLALAGIGRGAPSMDSPNQYLDGSPLDRFVLTGLLAAGLTVLFGRRQKIGTLLRANAPILIFFLYCLLSTLWSDYPDVSLKRWTKALGDVVMVLLVLTDPDRSSAIKRVLASTGFILLPLSVLFIKYYPDLGRGYDRWIGTQFYLGVAADKNMLGMGCLVFGLGALWRVLQEFRNESGSRKPLVAQGTILAMALWLLWKANSMTSLSCFVIAGTLITLTSVSAVCRKRAFVHLFVVGALALSMTALFLDAGSGLVASLGRDPTLTGRTALWTQLLHMNPNPLIGAGFESFWLGQRLEKLWSLFRWHPNEAHNGYLEVFLNLGWIGIALFALIIATGYRNIVRSLHRDPDTGRLKLAYFVAGVTYSFTEVGFRMMSPVWIFFLLATMAVPQPPVPRKGAAVLPANDQAGAVPGVAAEETVATSWT